MFLIDFFKSIGRLFVHADKALKQVQDLLPQALEVVQLVAEATPTRSDDEVVALLKKESLALPAFGNKENLLRLIARTLLSRRVGLKISDNVANAAVELAVVVFKSKQAQ